MKTTPALKINPQTKYAAQNAREGLINANDLSLLIGMDVAQLNKFSKMGSVNHYGEYHGKRFYNFQEIINWLSRPDGHTEAKPVIQVKLEEMLLKKDCPYLLEKKDSDQNVHIVWKDLA